MNSVAFACAAFCFALIISEATAAAPQFYEAKTSSDQVLFQVVIGENKVRVPNYYRTGQPALTFSLNGVKIEHVRKLNSIYWELQLNDNSTAQFRYDQFMTLKNFTQYWLEWNGDHQNVHREVCYHYGENGASWYNTYQSIDQSWPMNTAKTTPQSAFNSLLEYDDESPASEFFLILEHLFVNTDGFAVFPVEQQPLFIRRDSNHGDPKLCFSVNNTYPYDTTREASSYRAIKLFMYASNNIRNVTDNVVHHTQQIPKPNSIPDERKFRYPTSFVPSYEPKQTEVLAFANKLVKHGFEHNEVILGGQWDKVEGSLTFDETRFPKVDNMISKMHTQGLRPSLELYPKYISSRKPTFENFLTNTKNGKRTDILDFSRQETCEWFGALLKSLSIENNVHSFLTYSRSLANLKADFTMYPNVYAKNYLKTVSQAGNLTSWLAFKSQALPMFVQLVNHVNANQSHVLEYLIPNALAVSVGGYAFITPVPIGYRIPDENQEEIFIRWVQIATFMPSMSFNYQTFAWDSNQKVSDIMKRYVNLHAQHAPTIIELAYRRIKYGSPIIRPLWYSSPDDPKTYKIADQFMLGDDILVAPVVTVGARERSVYLPTGTWIDQHGATFTGPKEIKVAAPLEELPYFKRK